MSMLPSGVFFQSYAAEQGLLRTWPQRLGLAASFLLLASMGWLMNNYWLGILTLGAITLIAVLGLHITIGMAGLLNLGQSAFVGIGAFVAASMAANGWSIWVTLPCSGLAAGIVSILFGLPAVRIKGFYLALTTIAAQIIFPIVMIRLPDGWFGGSAGMSVESPVIFGWVINTPRSYFLLVLSVAAVAFLAAINLGRSRAGRAFRAIHDNDIASSVVGVNLAKVKIQAFFVGALFAGFSGALYAYFVRYVSTDQFTLWLSVWYVGMLIVGGMHTPFGAILGVAVITLLQEGVHLLGTKALSSFSGMSGGTVFSLTNVVLGGVIILMLLFEPLGLAHRWSILKSSYRIWPYPRG